MFVVPGSQSMTAVVGLMQMEIDALFAGCIWKSIIIKIWGLVFTRLPCLLWHFLSLLEIAVVLWHLLHLIYLHTEMLGKRIM